MEQLKNPNREIKFFSDENIKKINKQILKDLYIPKNPEELDTLLAKAEEDNKEND